jgi:hypothetical protein
LHEAAKLSLILLILTTFGSSLLAFYCPDARQLSPYICDPSIPAITCDNGSDRPLNLPSIFNKISKDSDAVKEKYYRIYIKSEKMEEIPENALGNLTFKAIYIDESPLLKRIHSNAFSYQTETTTKLDVFARNVISGPAPYNFYDLVNSFSKLQTLFYRSQIETLEPKFNINFSNMEDFYVRVKSIKGSPFSKMDKIWEISFEGGDLNHIPNGAFKVATPREKSYSNINIHLTNNKLNGSSFEKDVFMDPSFENLNVLAILWENEIEYLNEDVFLPFLSKKSRNNGVSLKSNPLNCEDCRSSWICKSSTSDQVRKSIQQAKCLDLHHERVLTDCKQNFLKCK